MSCEVCRGYGSQSCPSCGERMNVVNCPECEGTGIDHRLAFNIRSRELVEVTPLTWLLLPTTEEQAEEKGWNYCRTEADCPYCKGMGEIYQDSEGHCYPML